MDRESWYKLPCHKSELQLLATLSGGQSFRWKMNRVDEKERWTGVFDEKVWILEQTDDNILYQVHSGENSGDESHYQMLLKKYFRLDINLDCYYSKWSEADPYFKEASKQFYGVRILNQDLTENIFSFICSSNNHISRISSMVEKLATFYGKKICDINEVSYYSFPKIADLCGDDVETKLNDNGFGYRGKYINKTAKFIKEAGDNQWMEKLKKMNYEEAKKTLMLLSGVGPKVADCVCLMSLGHLETIPIDTHIYQIAARLYMPKLMKTRSLNDTIYKEIGDHFKKLYGDLAGWAHTILFCSDLKKFKNPNIPQEAAGPSKKRKKTK